MFSSAVSQMPSITDGNEEYIQGVSWLKEKMIIVLVVLIWPVVRDGRILSGVSATNVLPRKKHFLHTFFVLFNLKYSKTCES